MKLAVIGGGNGAFATAADLALMGNEVTMFNRTPEKLDPVRKLGGIYVQIEGRKRFARGVRAEGNIKDAVSQAEVLIVAVPTVAHAEIAAKLGRYIQNGQTVLLNPGHTGGGLEFRSVLNQKGIKTDFQLYETMTLTYITRILKPGVVAIYTKSKNILYSGLPPRRSKKLEKLFPNVRFAKNVLQTGLSNINAMCHPPGMILNAGWIEATRGGFHFYTQGMTPSVSRVVEGLDRERLQIMRSLGLKPVSFVDLFFSIGSTTRKGSVYDAMKASKPNRSIRAPATLESRYVNEDVGYGLVPMVEFGRVAGIKWLPIMESLTNLACIMNGVNYWKDGRSASKLGIEGISKEHLLELVNS